MTKEEIISTVKEFLVKEFEVDPTVIVPEANLRTTLDLDSLDYVDLVVVSKATLVLKLLAKILSIFIRSRIFTIIALTR